MFIARGMHQIQQSPRGATVPICLNRGLDGFSGRHGERERVYLAPAGRHVYRTRHAPNTQSPRGATCTIRLNHGLYGFSGRHGERERVHNI